MFDKAKEHLNLKSVLYILRLATKKESRITVQPPKISDKLKKKRRIVDISKIGAAKIPKRVGFTNNKHNKSC